MGWFVAARNKETGGGWREFMTEEGFEDEDEDDYEDEQE
jgi:hypothetical protein